MSAPRPAVSVIVVSDYGGRRADEWNYLRDTLGALREAAANDPVEVLLVDANPASDVVPRDILTTIPGMRVVAGQTETSRALLNRAVESASAELVAMLDGDCAPAPAWLRAGIARMRAHPELAVISGRTVYPATSFRNRVLATLSRSFLDPGRAAPTRFVSSNNALFRRAVLLAHPLPAFPRPLAMRLQAEAIRSAGGQLYFEPAMHVVHRFDGWSMERRIRRNIGYRAIRVRQLDPRVPHAGLLRLGVLCIPLMLVARTIESWWNCVRSGTHYGLRWFELPAACATAVYVHCLEIGGMRAALAEGRPNGHSGESRNPGEWSPRQRPTIPRVNSNTSSIAGVDEEINHLESGFRRNDGGILHQLGIDGCVRLPLRIDAARLAAELEQLPVDAWSAASRDPVVQAWVESFFAIGYPRGPRPVVADDRPVLRRLPYLRELLREGIRATPRRAIVARLLPRGFIPLHTDTPRFFRDTIRLSLQVAADGPQRLYCNGLWYEMQPGEVWAIDNLRPHAIRNDGNQTRINVLVDYLPANMLTEMIASGERGLGIVDMAAEQAIQSSSRAHYRTNRWRSARYELFKLLWRRA